MKVKELIEALKKEPPEADVVILIKTNDGHIFPDSPEFGAELSLIQNYRNVVVELIGDMY